ncbi:MAG: putative D,D-dipeptide-binding periplasmic protein DdpA [Chlamydiae bacterium]|nr:putative D,D-dipeptide-binding periplasmic protein DdpA [Chlamydiota bacterium]
MKKYLFLFALCLLSHVHAIPPQDTVVVATKLDDLISLDPAEIFEPSGLEYAHNTYDRLVFYDSDNEGQFKGILAQDWTITNGGKKFTFTLNKNVTFASGNPLTAEDAAFSLQRIVRLNKTPAYLFTQFGWTADNVHDKVYAENPHTLVIETDQAYAQSLLLYCLTTANAAILDKKLVLSHEANGDLGHTWLKTHYAGSGPFTLVRWTPNTGVFLQRNENYFRGNATLKHVILRSIPEESTQKMLLMKGDIDIARNLGLDQTEGINTFQVDIYPLSMTYFMSMNQKNQYLRIPQVRQALKYLIDYEGLESLARGKMTVHQSFIPKGFFAACEDSPFTLDVEKAKELLKEAGLEQGFTVNLDASKIELAQAIQAMFAKANIKVNILPGDSRQVLTKLRARKHDLSLSTWVPDYCDPNNNALTFAYNPDNSDDSKERTLAWRNSWEIPDINEKTLAAMKEQDNEKRRELYLQLQRHFHKEAPFVNIFQENRVLVQRKESLQKGVRFLTPLDILSYYTSETASHE